MELTTITPLPDEIAVLLANTRQATAEELTTLENAAASLRKDPQFLAEISKELAQEENLHSVEEAGFKLGSRAPQS